MEAVAAGFVECDNAIIAGGNDVLSPSKSVGDGGVHNAGLGFGVDVHRNDGAIEEASSDAGAIWA